MKQPSNMVTPIGLPVTGTAFVRDEEAPGPADEHALVRSARDGDRAAFERLYALYGRMVHGILLARVPRPHVDDLVQDVFMTAWQRLSSLREESAFGGWLAAIARNRATDHHRNSVDTVELSESDRSTQPRPDAPIDAARALAMIRSLPDAYRETLVLRLVEGLSGPEIAERTGLTPASVRVNLHRGMKLLRVKLGIDT